MEEEVGHNGNADVVTRRIKMEQDSKTFQVYIEERTGVVHSVTAVLLLSTRGDAAVA